MANPINLDKVPPIPPPLPPAFPVSLKASNEVQRLHNEVGSGETETKHVEDAEFISQISSLLDTRLTGSLSSEDNEVALCVVMPLRTIIKQNGPMCGIVALAEGLELLNKNETTQDLPQKILNVAKDKNMTKQGEMFSIIDMKSLAEIFGACQHSEIVCLSNEVEPEKKPYERVVQNLIKGFPVLFPYDVDYNHSPALRKGHAAHWAVVHGIASRISQSKILELQEQTEGCFKVLKSSPEQLILQPIHQSCCSISDNRNYIDKLVKLFDYETSFAIAHQGKSFHTGFWKISALFESNFNLNEIDPKITAKQSEFIYHDIIEGLCSKALLLKL